MIRTAWKPLAICGAAVCICALIASAVGASPLPLTQGAFVNSLGSIGYASPPLYNVGWAFTLSAPYDVTNLGYLDVSSNGFNESHDVGIYSSTGVLLVSATVSSADPLQNGFRWVSVPTTTLGPGTYVLDGTAGTEHYQYTGGSVTFDPRVTWLEGRYIAGATLAFPTLVNPNPPTSYYGPNFGTVPEPATLTLLGLGLAGVARAARRRKR